MPPRFSDLATALIPNLYDLLHNNKCTEPMECIRTSELIPTNQHMFYQKTWYNYFPTKILGLPMALVWDNTIFQCLWLVRDVKINYRIFMSYIFLLHATLQLWQPKKNAWPWISQNHISKKNKNNPQHWGWGVNQK